MPAWIRAGLSSSPALAAAAFLAAGGALLSNPVAAQPLELSISVKDHKFDPPELSAPPDKAIALRVKNLDASPMEFESNSLKVEKVLTGNSEAVVNIRAQKPGRYEFFDDFHQQTRGVLVVK
jgi:hypothetical protein